MFFTRSLISLFALGSIISTLALPSHSPVEKREDLSDVMAVLVSLESSTDLIVPEIDSHLAAKTATPSNISPLLNALKFNVETATASLEALEGKVDNSQGGTKDEVAVKSAAIVRKIIEVCDSIKTKEPSLYWTVVESNIERTIYRFLVSLEAVVTGVLVLVGNILNLVLNLVYNLGFGLVWLLFGWAFPTPNLPAP